MRTSLRIIAWLIAISGLPVVFGQASAAAPGVIVDQKACVFGQYEQQSGFTKKYYSKEDYDAARSSSRTECSKIEYMSDGLKVVGYLVRPRSPVPMRYPVIIFNRGGFLDLGKIESFNLVDFIGFADRGFVVLASQYRGNDGGEGHEELVAPIWMTCQIY
jgi:acetyl esterase/lipase